MSWLILVEFFVREFFPWVSDGEGRNWLRGKFTWHFEQSKLAFESFYILAFQDDLKIMRSFPPL